MSISSLNSQPMAKSMNGLNIINADQIYTNNFTANSLTANNLTLNATSGNVIKSSTNPNQYFYVDASGNIGYQNTGVANGYNWKIESNGNAYFKSPSGGGFKSWQFIGNLLRYYNLSSSYSVIINGDEASISLKGGGTNQKIEANSWSISNEGNIVCSNVSANYGVNCTGFTNYGIIPVYTSSYTITTGDSGKKIVVINNVATTLTLPYIASSFNGGLNYIISGNPITNGTIINGTIFDGQSQVNSITLGANETISIFLTVDSYENPIWRYDKILGDKVVDTYSAQNIYGAKTFNSINTEITFNNNGEFNNNGVFFNFATMYNGAYQRISTTSSLDRAYSGQKIEITVSSLTITLPELNFYQTDMFYTFTATFATGSATISAYLPTGNKIYNGSALVDSITIYANESIYFQVVNNQGNSWWIFNRYSSDNVTRTRYILNSTGSTTNVITSVGTAGLFLNDNPIYMRTITDANHYIKFVNTNANSAGGNTTVDGIWIQGNRGGVLASQTTILATQIYFQWKNSNNYSLVKLWCQNGLDVSGGLTVAGTITLPNNSIADSALSPNVAFLNGTQTYSGITTFSSVPICTATYGTIASNALITKNVLDTYAVLVSGNQTNIQGGKVFWNSCQIGAGSSTGLITRIGGSSVGSNWNSTKNLVGIGRSIANSNSAGMTNLDACVFIGQQAGELLAPTGTVNQIVAIGYQALRSNQSSANTGIGAYALASLTYGINNCGIGSACGSALVGATGGGLSCDANFACGSQTFSNGGRYPISETYWTGLTQTSQIIIFATAPVGIYAGCQIYFYSAIGGGNNSVLQTVTTWNSATNTLIMVNSQTIVGGSYFAVFSGGDNVTSNTYSGATPSSSQTTYVLDNNNTLITTSLRAIYWESATVQKYASVTGWDNTTKTITFNPAITISSGSTILFNYTATTNQSRGLNISYNTAIGTASLANVSTNAKYNVAVGYNAMNGVGTSGEDYDNKTYLWGTNNVCVGRNAGATICRAGASYNIFIGANTGTNGGDVNPTKTVSGAIAMGNGVNVFGSDQCCMGTIYNYWYYPTRYKVVIGYTPNINSSANTLETGLNGKVQIVSSDPVFASSVGKDGMAFYPYGENYNIINFANISGSIRGYIGGVNSSSVSYNTSSDERLKENINDMDSQIDNIQKLKPRKFKWKRGGENDVGFIAQEVFQIYPDMNPIKDNEKYSDKLYPKKEDGKDFLFGMDYGKMTPMLWKGLSELIDIVKQQQTEINNLKEIISRNNIQ